MCVFPVSFSKVLDFLVFFFANFNRKHLLGKPTFARIFSGVQLFDLKLLYLNLCYAWREGKIWPMRLAKNYFI